MSDKEDKIASTESDGDEVHIEPHHHRNHRHRIRVKQKIKLKKSNSRVKKKAKKYLSYIVWSFLVILFILSIVLLISELNKLGITKDRRNKKSEILFKEKHLYQNLPLQS